MNIEEKIGLIKEHKADFLSALTAYLDKMYDMTDSYLNEDGDLKEFLDPDEKVQNFIKEIVEDEEKYEIIRKKIIDEDFNLSLYEVNLIGLAMAYISIRFDKYMEEIKKAKEKAQELYKALISEDYKETATDK